MCACKPGATCSYHTYALWPQERKDAWNARRRARYASKKLNAQEPVDYGDYEGAYDDAYAVEPRVAGSEREIPMSARVARLDNRQRALLRGYRGQPLSEFTEEQRAELFKLTEKAGFKKSKSLEAGEFRERLLQLAEELGE